MRSQKSAKALSAQYKHTGWLISACCGLSYGLFFPLSEALVVMNHMRKGPDALTSRQLARERHGAVQDWVPVRWSDRRQELTRSSAGWGMKWRGGMVGEGSVGRGGGKQCEPLFPTYHPLGSQRRRHAGATSSPPVASHVKPGDFSSTLARMLFLPRLWVGLLDKRVSSCAIIIPQVFGWREGPSHLLKTGVGQKSVGMQVCKPRRHSLSLTCWAISVLTFLVHLHSRDISNW